ncbi:hypothetical protein C2G38_1988879, partial [Gigaspora rosea]
IFPETKHFLCIFHIQQNIHKKLKRLLGTNYEKFIKIFYRTRNSLNESDFERPSNYLQGTLYPIQHTWVLWYQSLWFTAGIQSNQKIEALNALLKIGVNHMSSLCHLHEECQRLFDNQAQYSQLEEYQNSVLTRGLPIASQVIFPQIDSILIKFVTPHILSIQRQQMNESLLYHAARLEVPVSEFNNNEVIYKVQYIALLVSSIISNTY